MRRQRLAPLVLSSLAFLACQEPRPWNDGGADADTGGVDADDHTDADDQADAHADTSPDGDASDDAGDDAAPDGDADGEPSPPCEPVAGSSFTVTFDPPTPWSGGSARVRAHGDVGLTNIEVVLVGAEPSPTPVWVGVEGDGPWTWTWSLDGMRPGSWCVELRADPDGALYQRALLTIGSEPPPVAPFKIVEHHQWTCEEMYTWAINVDTRVIDEAGAPIPGVRIAVEHEPCDIAEDHPPPSEVITDGDGFARWENYNPSCFFHLRVADAPSDTAIEIWTGIWEEQEGCNFCSTFAVNVYGHWSYSVTFQRTPGATEICQVQHDQAGQSRCPPLPHWEDPVEPVCLPL